MASAPSTERRLATGLCDLWPARGQTAPHFDILIVGSGYGGSVAAAQLAGRLHSQTGQPLQICLLERGKEYLPGEFPATFGELPAHMRMARPAAHRVTGQAEGLFDVRLGQDVVALVASGLGGGSLINAGVLLEPRTGDFAADPQMHQLVSDLQSSGAYQRAQEALGGRVTRQGVAHPNTIDRLAGPALAKTLALEQLKRTHTFQRPPLSVAFDNEPNAAGIRLSACTRCGDCLTGCNAGAKDSLDTNLLALAAAQTGFRICTGATVLSLSRPPGSPHWTVATVHTDPQLQSRETGPLGITADRVILAAGALGSTEILLRSRDAGLALSARLGERFSCNGDNIAALHRLPTPVNGFADDETDPGGRDVGPTITGSIQMPGPDGDHRGFLLQEFSVPGPLARAAQELITTTAHIHRMARPAEPDEHGDEARMPDPKAVSAHDIAHSLVVGIIGHDDAQGVLHLPHHPPAGTQPHVSGLIHIAWPQARRSRDLLGSHRTLKNLIEEHNSASDPARATIVAPNPLWQVLPKALQDLVSQPLGPALTVHPLGGCSMGSDMADGVVDPLGQVFTTGDWFGSLVVLDGSVLRGSLGVNPALTIAATAFRAMDRLVPAWTRSPSSGLPAAFAGVDRARLEPRVPPAPRPRCATTIEIVERLHGPVRLDDGMAQQDCWVELTLAYEPFAIRPWLTHFGRRLSVSGARQPSTLRVYQAATWQQQKLAQQTETERQAHAIFEADVTGHLGVLDREASHDCQRKARALWAWLVNRGARDLWNRYCATGAAPPEPEDAPSKEDSPSQSEVFWALANQAGEVRLFEYDLKIGTVRKPWSPLKEGAVIRGNKRITYNRRANPWQQLTRLRLNDMPGLVARGPRSLELDPRFLATQGLPLLRITAQHDQTTAWLDLLSLGLLFTRVLLGIHLWTFRKPDTPPAREPQRLPGPIDGLAPPDITDLVVDHDAQGNPVSIRLTHYRPLHPGRLPPLAMIHGYSVSGNTFTHPSLHPSAAEFFCRQGRDVWVVDLRTSTGLPTATQPWSMEQVALIDIPAALVHIRQASQSRVDVLAHCIGCVMLSMALLTTAQDVRSGPLGEGLGTDLDAGHLDTLERFNRREPDANAPHPCVRKIILSQKGPVLRYTDDNIFRAFVLQTVRRWLLAEGYQFRPPASPTLRDELLDRLLASVPYPQADYDIENPFFPPWKQTPWVGTRHRMDALYGRDFNADQLSDATLEAIDDLFGPIHLDTVAQTIHFNRYNTITDRRGRGDFVTPERLAQRWNGISTLALHGRRNGLVDVSTQDLLTANMRKAGLPFRALPSDRSPYDELGHQDVLIGMASERVFLDVETFLRETAPPALAPAPSSPEFELALPWLGPRLLMPHTGMASLISPGVQLACMSHPAQGKAHLALVPVLRQANGSCQRVGTPTFGPQASSGQWLLCTPDPQPTPPQPPASTGLLALVVHRSADAWVHNGDNWPFSAVMTASAASQVSPAAIDAWLARQAPHELTVAYVDHTALKRAQHLVLASAPTACGPVLAVGSCQYPAGLLDAWPAGASLRKLDRLIGARNVDALLMLGDQIYADATAGLADPTRRDELYEQPHDKALRFLPMQGVLRQIPAYTLPDDHEITDNWAPLPADVGVARPEEDRLNRLQRQHGLAAWRKFQHMHPPWADTQPHPWADQVFQLGGTPVFLLDTRTGRAARGSSVAPAQQHIVQPEQWDLLFAWMLAHPTEPKYVATPALLLPRRSRSAVGTRGHVHSDGWDGYPASLHRLLDFMASHGVRNTVFLSGDEHHSLCAQITVQRPQSPPLRLVSVHCSGFYAPFPFANGNPGQLVPQETFLLPPPQGVAAPVLSVQVETRFLGQANGFATVQACAHGHTCDVQVVFHPAESESPVEVRLSL